MRAARAAEDAVGRRWSSRGPSEPISASAVSAALLALQKSARPGEPVSSPVSIRMVELKPSAPRSSQHAGERRDVDGVLALVVGGAAAIHSLAFDHDLPRRQALPPLVLLAADHVAMAVGQHGRLGGILDPAGDQERAVFGRADWAGRCSRSPASAATRSSRPRRTAAARASSPAPGWWWGWRRAAADRLRKPPSSKYFSARPIAPFRDPLMATRLPQPQGGNAMTQAGQVVFSRMEEVVWGKPAAETVAALAQKRGAERVFLMVSGTLNRTTDEIDKLRRALGNKCVGTFDRMPRAYAAQRRDRRDRPGARGARRADRHPGRRLDHRRRQGRAALPRQRYPHAGSDGCASARAEPGEAADGARRSRSRPPCRPASSRTSPASPTSAPRSRSCSAIPTSCRARWCSIPP